MVLKTRELRSLLENKFGFRRAEGHSSDHVWYELELSGLPTILTKVSHGSREIGRKLEGKIARQLRVRKPFFRGMVNCTNDLDDYGRQVREDPYPPFHILF